MQGRTYASELDLVSASWIFEQVSLRESSHVDRSRIRRAVDEAAETYFDPADGGWYRWIVETAHSLDRNARVIDAELPELIRMTRDGVFIVLRSADGKTWHSLALHRLRSIRLGTPCGSRPIRVLTPRRLLRLLHRQGFDGMLQCVVIEPQSFGAGALASGASGASASSPLGRLYGLLQAERIDIWVIIIFALVSGLLGVATPLAVEALVNTVAFGRFLQPVIVLSLMLLAFLLFQAAIRMMQTFVVEIIQRRLFARVAADLSYRLPRTSFEVFDDEYAPELVNRFFDIVTVQKVVAEILLDGLSIVLSTIVGMAVLAFYHPFLLAFDLVLILLMLFTMFVLGSGAVKSSIKESKTKYAMAAWLEDLARCKTAFRYDGASEYALERSNLLIHDYLMARRKHFRVLMRQVVFMLLVQAVATTSLLGIGGFLVIDGQLSLGQLVAAELIVAMVVGSFAKMGKHMEGFYDLMASIDKLGVLLDLPLERWDGMLTAPSGGAISARNVSLSLSKGRTALAKNSFEIEDGEHVAVCGENGSGKTVLLELLFGLRVPQSGRILINGIEPDDLRPDVLRRQIALVREPEIFAGSVAENVHMERPNISMADVRAALSQVDLLSKIQQLPDSLDTELNQTGAPLTESQLCRLMLSRALAGKPDILLIDGVLDALPDNESRAILQSVISSQVARTILLVTNRDVLREMMQKVIQLQPADPAH